MTYARNRRQAALGPLAAEMIAGLAVLDPKIKAASRQLSELVEANGSGLMNLKGIGPSGAPPAR